MAYPSARLIQALRETAARLSRNRVIYRWASFAHCNCGHLAQTITGLDPSAIQERAMRRDGDWSSQARALLPLEFDFGDRPALDEGAWEPEDVGACPVVGKPLDDILTEMYELGLHPEDVAHLERLTDPEVRRRLGNNKQEFPHHRRENVVAYLQAWATLLEERLEETSAPQDIFAEAAE